MPVRATRGGNAGRGGGGVLKLRSYGNLKTSILHGAVELLKKDSNHIETPDVDEKTVDIDGREVTYALMSNVTQPPKIGDVLKKRKTANIVNLNVSNSTSFGRLGHRLQRWLTGKDIPTLTIIYLIAFLIMNLLFASFWYLDDDGCCDDPTMTFAETFDFAVQTSSTIGYGGFWPKGYFNNGLVVVQTILAICLSTFYAGLLFFKFITPAANFEFSEVMTISNVMGKPCIEVRVGNADGKSNKLINAEASLCVTSVQEYRCPHEAQFRKTDQSEELQLVVSSKHRLNGVWTLRHFIDNTSPLYGLRFDEFPGNSIRALELSVKAIQVNTKGEVHGQTKYFVEDIMIGHRFEDNVEWDSKTRTATIDYSKMSSTTPSMVWYPKGIADSLSCMRETE